MGEMQRPSALDHIPTSTSGLLTTSYLIQTIGAPGYPQEVVWTTLIYDPADISSSTETIFYTELPFGKGPDRPGITSIGVLTTVIPVIPSSTSTPGSSAAPQSTPEPTVLQATSTPTASHSSGLSSGALAGTIVGVILAALLILAFGAFVLVRRRRSTKTSSSAVHDDPKETPAAAPAALATRRSKTDYPLEAYKSSRSSSTTTLAHHGMDPAYMKEVEVAQVV